jgi:uncharacterized protein Yka (UPF0111/DUF47 family)
MTSDQMHAELRQNRDAVISLQSAYNSDMDWLKHAMDEQSKMLHKLAEKLDKVDRTVHNGLSHRVTEMHKHLLRVESCVDDIEADVDHKFERRKDEWHKTAALVVAILAVIVSTVAMVMAIT